MDVRTPSIPDAVQTAKVIILENDVSALEVSIEENSSERYGGISLIPKGSIVEISGSGFNDRTYRIRCEDRFFYVFLRDLFPVREPQDYFVAAGSR